jgi:uncharacterized protein YceK
MPILQTVTWIIVVSLSVLYVLLGCGSATHHTETTSYDPQTNTTTTEVRMTADEYCRPRGGACLLACRVTGGHRCNQICTTAYYACLASYEP